MKKLLCVVAVVALLVTVLGSAMADTTAPAKPKVQLPRVIGCVKTVTNDAAGKLASFVLTTGTGAAVKDITVKVGPKTHYVMITAAPGEKLVMGQNENKVDATAVKAGDAAICRFAATDVAMACAAKSVFLRVPKPTATPVTH